MIAVGPAWAQEGDFSGFAGDWAVVAVKEGGVGSGDTVRVRLLSEATAWAACDRQESSFPGYVYDGNFTIRSR